jgi:DNA repair exonuclease SbcCD ATPase subunit
MEKQKMGWLFLTTLINKGRDAKALRVESREHFQTCPALLKERRKKMDINKELADGVPCGHRRSNRTGGGKMKEYATDRIASIKADVEEAERQWKAGSKQYRTSVKGIVAACIIADVQFLLAALAEKNAEIADLKAHNNVHTWCAYCGHEIFKDDEAATKISEHIMSCPKHPMRAWERHSEALEEQAEKYREQIAVLTVDKAAETGDLLLEIDELQKRIKELTEALDSIRATARAVMEAKDHELNIDPEWVIAKTQAALGGNE